MNFNVVKYNYKNKEKNHKYNTTIFIENENIFYLNKRQKKKRLNDILGIVHGPLTTTWNFNYVKDINPKKCISIISKKRTWDFLFDKYVLLKIFFFATQDLQTIYNTPLHDYTKKYFIYINIHCRRADYENINEVGNSIWFNMNIIVPWKNLNSIKLERMYNNECPICLEIFDKEKENIMVLDCLHGYHRDCINAWLKNKSTCPTCNKRI